MTKNQLILKSACMEIKRLIDAIDFEHPYDSNAEFQGIAKAFKRMIEALAQEAKENISKILKEHQGNQALSEELTKKIDNILNKKE